MPQNMCSPCKSLFKLPKETCQILKGKPKRSKLFCSQSGEESAAWPEAGCVSGETKARKPAAGGRCLTRKPGCYLPVHQQSQHAGLASSTSLTGVPWSELLVTPALGYPGTPGLPSLSVSFTCEGNGQLLRFPEGRHLELSHVRHWHSERWLARRQDADRPLLNRVEH